MEFQLGGTLSQTGLPRYRAGQAAEATLFDGYSESSAHEIAPLAYRDRWR